MINIIIPVVDNVEDAAKFVGAKKSKKYKIIVGIRKSLADKFSIKSKFVDTYVFSDSVNCEEMINTLHSCGLEKGKVMILRRIPTEQEFVSLEMSSKDIAVLKAKKNKFVRACRNLFSTIIRKLFAFTYFDDISAVCFNENMFEMLAVCQNLSMVSRINKFVGVEIDYIETNNKQVAKNYNRVKAYLTYTAYSLFLLASIACVVCLGLFVELKALIIICMVFLMIFATFMWFVGTINFIRTLSVGDLHFGRAEKQPIKK